MSAPAPKMAAEAIAKIAYSTLRAYNQQIFGDYSQREWESAPEHIRGDYIARVQFVLQTPGAPPAALHDHWLSGLLLDGWRYGVVSNPKEKTHAKLVPFTKLAPEEQRRDVLFTRIVEVMAGI